MSILKKISKNLSYSLAKGIALFIYFTRLSSFFSWANRIHSMVSSEILRLQLHTDFRISMKRPFSVIGYKYIHLKGEVKAMDGLRIECISAYNGSFYSPYLEIGNGVSIGQRCHIGCINKITIGANVLLGSNVLITDHSHGKSHELDESPEQRPLYSKGEVIIEDDCWLCDNVIILPKVKIGKNSTIGAGCVVNKDIPANSIAVGNPIRIIPKKQ